MAPFRLRAGLGLGLGLSLCFGLAGSTALTGCIQRTTRPTEKRIITEADLAERERLRQEMLDERDEAILDAEEQARKELARDPTNPRWCFEVGRIEESAGNLAEAEILYRRGMAQVREDTYTGPHLFLGRILVKLGRFEEAARELERVVAIRAASEALYVQNTHYSQAYYLLGVARYELGDDDASRKAFKRYLRLGGSKSYVVGYFPDLMAAP